MSHGTVLRQKKTFQKVSSLVTLQTVCTSKIHWDNDWKPSWKQQHQTVKSAMLSWTSKHLFTTRSQIKSIFCAGVSCSLSWPTKLFRCTWDVCISPTGMTAVTGSECPNLVQTASYNTLPQWDSSSPFGWVTDNTSWFASPSTFSIDNTEVFRVMQNNKRGRRVSGNICKSTTTAISASQHPSSR